jgi:hypothetical protein
LPYVVLADGGFAMTRYMIVPYTQTAIMRGAEKEKKLLFNKKLSAARRIVESAFGILTKKFRLFSNVLEFSPDKCTQLILTATILHNFLIKTGSVPTLPETETITTPIENRLALCPNSQQIDRLSTATRETFASYYYTLQ